MPASPDPSRRYILPEDSPYLRNLSALWATNPALARTIEAVEDAPAPGQTRTMVEPSRSGPPTLTIKAADGRSFALHSRYDPLTEARRLADSATTDSCVAFYVLGFGLGYHVELLFERASREALFFVFEADLQVLRAALMHRDLSRLIESGRVTFLTSSDKSELFHLLTPHSAMCSMGFESLTHPPSLALHPHFYQEVQTWIAEFAAYARTCLSTLVINGRRTAQNIAQNIGRYATTPSVDELRGRYQGQPAIIVSAGPSLRRNKHLLKEADGRAVVIAVQTILQPLLEMGIEPQFVTSLDYHDISTRYYERLPRDLRTHLVAEPKASPAIFSVYPGPVTILGNEYADQLLREIAPPRKGRLPSGATVAHLAYYLAEHLGCDPIIFVGQDLGFSDGLAYAPGTNIDDVWRPELGRFCTVEMRQWEFIARDRHILRKIPDQQNRPMYTEERLFTYLQQFERDFLRSGARIIDATEGGAKKRGATAMKLAEAIQQYCTAPLAPQGAGDGQPGRRWGSASQCVASLQSRCEEARQIQMIAKETLPLLEEIRDHLHDQPRVNRAISRIDALRQRMNALGATYDLVTQFTQASELERFQQDRRMAASRLVGTDLQKRQIDRDLSNVRAIAEAAREFQRTAGEVIQKLLQFTDPAGAPPATRQEAA